MKNVLLTIDTEGPRGSDPVLYQIWGKVGDNYYGIPKIIEMCDKHNATGLFFVDFAEVYDYGYDKIKEVVDYILNKGHDVGVHIHPHHLPNENRHFLWEYSYEEQYNIIEKCTEIYERIVGKKPLSFRAGKYGANNDTLEILSKLGYKYDFSEFYSQKWCGIEPHFSYALPQKYLDLVEIPVTVFQSLSLGNIYSRYDKLEVTENPNEIVHILNQYSKTENEEIIVLFLHSFSFLNYLNTPDAPTLKKSNLKHFEVIMQYVQHSKNLNFISEKDLKGVNIYQIDSVDNIVSTKGLVRQLIYSFIRLCGIRNNKKVRFFIMSFFAILTMVITVFAILIGGF